MSELQIRHTVESLFALKLSLLRDMEDLQKLEVSIGDRFREFHGYSPLRIDNSFRHHSENINEKAIDQGLWLYLVRLYSLEKYMLCTDWEKMRSQIEHCQTPDFTPENANGWLNGLQGLILDNVKTLVKQVYRQVIDGTYYVGGRNGDKKKRNNNGIDKRFIIHTGDWNQVFNYWSDRPSIMDDLEKVCYLLDGKTLPEKTLRETMRATKEEEAGNGYMAVKLCRNGNTHFVLADATLEALNRYGPDGSTIGENIKIKVFTDRWAS